MTYDIKRIGKMISDIERYFRDLNELNVKSIRDLEDKRNYYTLSMILFSILNRTIDLGEEMVVTNNLGMPSTYREIFSLLMENGFIDKEMEKELSRLVFYRNLISHEYYDFGKEDIFDVYKRIHVVEKFVKVMKREIGS